MAIFDDDQFVADCLEALAASEPAGAVRSAMERAMADPSALAERFSVPVDADDDGILFRSPEILVTCAIFPKGFVTGIHDHATAAIIGVWAGHEDNLLYRPTPTGIESRGGQRVETGEVLSLGVDDIHDVHAPATSWSGALHVYLADIVTEDRHEWATPDSSATPFDGAKAERRWLEAAESTGLVNRP